MLTRREEVSPKEQYYADSLLTKPTTGHSVFTNLAVGVATPIVALNMLDGDFAKKPEGKAVLNFMDSVRLENATPGMGTAQKITGEISNMIGFGLNPITWGLGAAGGIAARGVVAGAGRIAPDVLSVFLRRPIAEMVSKPIGQYIPSMYGRGAAETPLTLGLVSKKTLETFGSFAGAGVPQGIVDNYNRDTNHIKWGGVAREAGEMGAFGIALGSLPFAWGVLRGKINRARGADLSESINNNALDQALADGHITEAEHKWYVDYLEHQKNPGDEAMTTSLQERGSVIANENGHTANTVSNEAMFEILTPNDVSNLHGAVSDQISGGVPDAYKTSLSDFIIHNRMDYIRQNPKWLDGVRGYVDFINQKLIAKPSKIAEADTILDEHLLTGMHDKMPFSQEELLTQLRESNIDTNELKNLPIVIPENIYTILKNDKKDFFDFLHEQSESYKFNRLSTNSDFMNNVFYHGTGDLKNIKEFDVSRTNLDALYGAGLYITDNKMIASGYSKARQKLTVRENESSGRIHELKFNKPPKLVDVEKAPSKDVFKIIRDKAKEFDVNLKKSNSTKSIDDIFKELKKQLKENPETKGRDMGFGLTLPPIHYLERYSDLINEINTVLSEHGFDGYLHTGGNRWKAAAKVNHNVVVLFGHDYVQHGVSHVKNPSEILDQKLIDMYYDYKEKIKNYASELKSKEGLAAPKDELLEIKSNLFDENGALRPNLERSVSYHRLVDLSHFWNNAKTLLDRVNLEQEYNRQEAFRDLANQVLKIADNDMPRVAKPENVMDYMKHRIEGTLNKVKPVAEVQQEVKAKRDVPQDADSLLAEQSQDLQAIHAEEMKHEFEVATERFKEFKGSENIFKNLISCVIGGLNA